MVTQDLKIAQNFSRNWRPAINIRS